MYEQFSGYKLNSNFTMLPNITLQDSELSTKALGVLVRIMSFPKSWKFSFNTLLSKFAEGRDYIRGAINELIELGYVVKKEKRVKGRFDAIYYRFYPYRHHQMKALQEIGILTYEDDWEVDDFDDNSTPAPKTDFPSSVKPPTTLSRETDLPETVTTNLYIKNIPLEKEISSSKEGSEEVLNFGEGQSNAVEAQPISPVKEAKIEAEGQGAFRKENNETVPPARNIKVNNASHKDKENDPLFVSVAEEWGKTPKEVYEGFKCFIKQSVGDKANNPEAYAEGTIKKAIADPVNNQLWQDYLKANKPPATEPTPISLLAAVTEFKCHYSSNSSYAIQRILEIFKPFGWTFEDFLFHARKNGFSVEFLV